MEHPSDIAHGHRSAIFANDGVQRALDGKTLPGILTRPPTPRICGGHSVCYSRDGGPGLERSNGKGIAHKQEYGIQPIQFDFNGSNLHTLMK